MSPLLVRTFPPKRETCAGVKNVITGIIMLLIPVVYVGIPCLLYRISDLTQEIQRLNGELEIQKKKSETRNEAVPPVDEAAFRLYQEKGNSREGLEALLKAAESGHVEARYTLAGFYYRGQNFAKDETEALRLYTLAAEAGNVQSMLNVGDYWYAQGHFREAWQWFLRAEAQGEAQAMLRLSMMYLQGEYVPKCVECAEQKRLSAQAAGLVSKELQAGHAVVDEKGKTDAEAVLKDEDLYRMAAESGNVQSQMTYAGMLLTGDMVQKDVERALYWYEKASETSPKAAESLAAVYEHGLGGVRKNDHKALLWYEKAAQMGSPEALYHCGLLMLNDKKSKTALSYFEKAGELGHAPSLYYVGRLYENGADIPKNEKKYMEAYLASARKGNKDAMRRLIRIFEKQKKSAEVQKWKKELQST